MKRYHYLFSSVLYFLLGLCICLILCFSVFQFGRGVYSAVQFYQIKNQFFQVSAEIAAVEEYVPAYCPKDKDYKVTMTYEYADDTYQYSYDYKQVPKEKLGDWIVLHIDPRNPEVTKTELLDRILAGVLIFLFGFSIFELWRCKKKSSYCYVSPFNPQMISRHLSKINQRDMHKAFRSVLTMILAGALIWVNDSEEISWFFVPVVIVAMIGIGVLFIRIVRNDRLKNDEIQLYFDTCSEKKVENYEDSACHYLILEEMEKVFSVSEKVYRRVQSGDDICLVYFGKSKKKPYLMCMEKR